jgi:glycerophosphoryl diester phosphodiesterase
MCEIVTKIFAHRGYSAKFPENTMKAFIEAEKAGADALEIDVQLTKDGEVVIIHDEMVDRVTNGHGYVKDLSFKELRKLDAGFHKKTIVKKEPIPSLEELLEWMTSNRLICNIELKNNLFPYEGMEEKVIELVRKYHLSNRIIISSFNHYSIVYSYRLAPEIEIAPLFSQSLYMPWVYAQSIHAKGIHPKLMTVTDEIIRSSIENGIQVRPYTVNKEADMKRLFSIGCSALITDEPEKALKIRRKIQSAT